MNKTGEWGEIYAARYLRDKGYYIIAANYTSKFGELDLVCTDDKFLIVVEVKARSNIDFAKPREYVDEGKRSKIALTAAVFVSQNKIDLPIRFDVIEIYFDGSNFSHYKLNHIKDAFRQD